MRLAIVVLALSASACLADSALLVKTSVPWSVTGGDDLAQLKRLASGVGWEFEPNEQTTGELKRIGIKTIRCINVDPIGGHFDEAGKFIVGEGDYSARLESHLETCRAVGAKPHIIIAQGLREEIRLKAEDVKDRGESVMGLVQNGTFGPADWAKFQAYYEAFFEYILVTKGFPEAEFEVANEPDIGGVIYPAPPKPERGSRALYEAYFNLYKNVAIAADHFEKGHPGLRVKLGGPALAWAFTFRFGDFNWAERFIQDCGEQKVKLDFIGVHYYGNISSLDGEYEAYYPPFTGMLKTTLAARDRYCPGVPIQMTEWGATYVTDNSAPSVINGNNVGAAWGAAFLNLMLQSGVDRALYLVTTDLRRQKENGEWESVWGWPSLFASPTAVGGTVPKAPFHVFEMVSRLEGQRVEATRGGRTVNCFVSADPAKRTLTALVWNYGYQIPEGGPGAETAVREPVTLRVRDAADFFGAPTVRANRWLVSETVSNAYHLFSTGQKLDDAALQRVDSASVRIVDGALDFGFAMPPSSVALVVLTAE